MRTWIVALSVVALAGCAGTGRLLKDGKVYPLTKEGGVLMTTIDGELYRGSFVVNNSYGSTTTMVNGKPVVSTGGVSGNQGRALFTSASGKVLRCDFMVSGRNAIGQCTDQSGGVYDLVAE
ncbi:MAG: hypothetical protein ACRC7C_19810 [Beijerinckiaceae bacterium]